MLLCLQPPEGFRSISGLRDGHSNFNSKFEHISARQMPSSLDESATYFNSELDGLTGMLGS